MVLMAPLNAYIARQFMRYQRDINAARDGRVKLTTELLQGAKLIKMLGSAPGELTGKTFLTGQCVKHNDKGTDPRAWSQQACQAQKSLLDTLAVDGVAANVLRSLRCADVARCLCACGVSH